MTGFALVSTTRGDELISPVSTVVAVSPHKENLERLRDERSVERQTWLASNHLPQWAEAGIISNEEIKEVPLA